MSDVPIWAFGVFGLLWALQLFVQLETIRVARETRAELYTAVRHFAKEFSALRDAHEAHVAGNDGPAAASVPNSTPQRRRSTDIADWVVDSGLGNGLGGQRQW